MPTAVSPQPSPQELAGRTLRMMREAHDVGLRELAGMVGITAGHLSRIESGERRATADVMQRICDTIAELPPSERAS